MDRDTVTILNAHLERPYLDSHRVIIGYDIPDFHYSPDGSLHMEQLVQFSVGAPLVSSMASKVT